MASAALREDKRNSRYHNTIQNEFTSEEQKLWEAVNKAREAVRGNNEVCGGASSKLMRKRSVDALSRVDGIP